MEQPTPVPLVPVVDSDARSGAALRETLEDAGYSRACPGSARSTSALIAGGHFDIALLADGSSAPGRSRSALASLRSTSARTAAR